MLDVHFRRRTYAVLFAILTALAAAVVTARHRDLQAVELIMLVGYLSVTFYQGAVGGWMGSLIDREDEGRLATWFNVANIGAGGLMVVAGAPVILHAPPPIAAVLVAVVLLLPTASFSLTNLLGGLGGDYHASAAMVSLLGGAGTMLAGIGGSLLVPLLARRVGHCISASGPSGRCLP